MYFVSRKMGLDGRLRLILIRKYETLLFNKWIKNTRDHQRCADLSAFKELQTVSVYLSADFIRFVVNFQPVWSSSDFFIFYHGEFWNIPVYQKQFSKKGSKLDTGGNVVLITGRKHLTATSSPPLSPSSCCWEVCFGFCILCFLTSSVYRRWQVFHY